MKIDFKEISKAWFNSVIHSSIQKELADARFEICLTCPSKKEIFEGKEWSLKCGECGCPLKAKIYTYKTYLDKDKSCPLDKWKSIEEKHLDKIKKKNKSIT